MPPNSTVEMRSWGSAVTWPAGPLFPLIPRAERHPLGAEGGELLRPHRVQLPVLPLQHVVLHALVRVLAVLRELHSPAVEHGADGHVDGEHSGAKLVEVVGLRVIEHHLEEPEPRAGEAMAGQWLVPRPLLDGLAEVHLELARLGPEGFESEARGGLGEHEGAVALRAQGLAEVDGAVAGGPRVDEGLEHEVLLARLTPEEHGVVAARDVVNDVGVEL